MRCPVCKAEITQGPLCRRCKADLGLLFTLHEQRQRELALAHRRLSEGRWPEAVRHARAADAMRQDDESRRLVAVASLMARDFAAAWQAWASGRDERP